MDTMPDSLLPQIISKYASEHKTQELEAASGHEQRLNQWFSSKSSWRFTWVYKENDMLLLQQFFDNQGGKFKTWLVTDSRIGVDVKVKFNQDKLDITPMKWKGFKISVDVREVF